MYLEDIPKGSQDFIQYLKNYKMGKTELEEYLIFLRGRMELSSVPSYEKETLKRLALAAEEVLNNPEL